MHLHEPNQCRDHLRDGSSRSHLGNHRGQQEGTGEKLAVNRQYVISSNDLVYRICSSTLLFLGLVSVRRRGKHCQLRHQCPAEPRSRPEDGCEVKPCWGRGDICQEVQHPVRPGKLFRGCKGCCISSQGKPVCSVCTSRFAAGALAKYQKYPTYFICTVWVFSCWWFKNYTRYTHCNSVSQWCHKNIFQRSCISSCYSKYEILV